MGSSTVDCSIASRPLPLSVAVGIKSSWHPRRSLYRVVKMQALPSKLEGPQKKTGNAALTDMASAGGFELEGPDISNVISI